MTWSMRRSNGSRGSTRAGCWSRSATFRRRSTKRSLPPPTPPRWGVEHSTNRVSDNPGAIHSPYCAHTEVDSSDRCVARRCARSVGSKDRRSFQRRQKEPDALSEAALCSPPRKKRPIESVSVGHFFAVLLTCYSQALSMISSRARISNLPAGGHNSISYRVSPTSVPCKRACPST